MDIMHLIVNLKMTVSTSQVEYLKWSKDDQMTFFDVKIWNLDYALTMQTLLGQHGHKGTKWAKNLEIGEIKCPQFGFGKHNTGLNKPFEVTKLRQNGHNAPHSQS